MNKELKTLINNLEGCIGMFDYMLTPIENNLLLLYINELQQENEKLKEKIENRGDFIVEQRKKIEDELVDNIEDDVVLSGVLNHMDMLNITIDTQLKTIKLLKQENKELHNKIDKAIEYLETNGYGYDCCGDMCYFLDENNQKDLLEILKDSDVDECE